MLRTCENTAIHYTRRGLLSRTAAGFGGLALAALHADWSRAAPAPPATPPRQPAATPQPAAQKSQPSAGEYRSPLAPKAPHFPARAKRVIFLFMEGGPSHLDTFDHKPALIKAGGRYLPPAFPFTPCGKSGLMMAGGLFPNLARQADDLCLLNGMRTNSPGHQQAVVAVHTGSETFVRPSMGAWVTYGLGTIAQDLPGYVTINPVGHLGGAQNYGSAFLPAAYQGTRMSGGQRGVPNVANNHLATGDQRRQLDFIQRANRRLLAADPGHVELEGLIESYELAFKMQTSIPDALDLASEPQHVRDLYGIDDGATEHFGTQCLMARRLAEKGVRFIQLTSTGWDHHNKIREALTGRAAAVDKPMAGLLADLKRTGLLKDTLVVWGGEFGRGPHQDNPGGRGHNAKGYTMWMAGGGVRGGLRYGSTDEMGGEAVDGIMGTHDLHATILHLLGLDHEELTYKYAGRDFRLTDTSGKVAKRILA